MESLLYIHLPFCSSKCRYCDFYSLTNADTMIFRYIDALAGEWKLRTANHVPVVKTVYIGGGTPSLLSVEQWKYMAERLFTLIPFENVVEWTVECNPDSIQRDKLELLAGLGVNRLTIGIQSLCDAELRLLGRPHTAAQARAALALPALGLFRSVGVDVMYGIPGQTEGTFAATLDELLTNNIIAHCSAYELTIAEKTSFGRHHRLLPLPTEEAVSDMAELLFTKAPGYGFSAYEISNFAREGYRCLHNCGYWEHAEYIGLGAAAHSYERRCRTANVDNIEQYCILLEQGAVPAASSEYVDAPAMARELLFLGFRKVDGINEHIFEAITGRPFKTVQNAAVLERFLDGGLLRYDVPWWRPTPKGLLCADYLARELF